MTNYSNFPKWRKYGIVITFSEHKFSWCENTQTNRKYLIESEYCSNGIDFYIWENGKTYTALDEFKEYLHKRQPEEPNRVCPICGGRLVLRTNKSNGEQFWGCHDYPKCMFVKKA
jgi:hypothetical protein